MHENRAEKVAAATTELKGRYYANRRCRTNDSRPCRCVHRTVLDARRWCRGRNVDRSRDSRSADQMKTAHGCG